MSNTGAEAVKPEAGCYWHSRGWVPMSGMKVRSSVVQPLRIPLVIRPLRRTSVVVVK